MILVFEGVDASGKTTVGKQLASLHSRGVYYPTPPPSLKALRDAVDRSASNEDHYSFYLEAVKVASREMALFDPTALVVVDRYWLTTYVYHRAMGMSVDRDDFLNLLMPDYTVYLDVSHDVQMRRLEVRGMSAGDVRMLSRQNDIRSYYDEHLHLRMNGEIIRFNTDLLSLNELVELISKRISA